MGLLNHKSSRESVKLPGTSTSFFGISGLPDQAVPPLPPVPDQSAYQQRRQTPSPSRRAAPHVGRDAARTPPPLPLTKPSSSFLGARLPPGLGQDGFDSKRGARASSEAFPRNPLPPNPSSQHTNGPARLVRQREEVATAAPSPFMSQAQYQRIENWVKHDAVPAATDPATTAVPDNENALPPLPRGPDGPSSGTKASNSAIDMERSNTTVDKDLTDTMGKASLNDDFDFRATLAGYRAPGSSRASQNATSPPATPQKSHVQRPDRRESLQASPSSGYLNYYAGMPNGSPRGGPSARGAGQSRSSSPVKQSRVANGYPSNDRQEQIPSMSPMSGPRHAAITAFLHESPAQSPVRSAPKDQLPPDHLSQPLQRQMSPSVPVPGSFRQPVQSNGNQHKPLPEPSHAPAATRSQGGRKDLFPVVTTGLQPSWEARNGPPRDQAPPPRQPLNDHGEQTTALIDDAPRSAEAQSPVQNNDYASRLNEPEAPDRSAAIFSKGESGPKFEHALVTCPQTVLVSILTHLKWPDVRNLRRVSKTIKHLLDYDAREIVLQRYLGPYGYRTMPTMRSTLPPSISSRALAPPHLQQGVDPRLTRKALIATSSERREQQIILELQDLDAFYAGRNYGVREYARRAQEHSRRNLSLDVLRTVRAATRAWNRIVIRLRAQATMPASSDLVKAPFLFRHIPVAKSPIYKPGRSPVLRVWVPSRKSWMDDIELVECEREVWRSGVWNLLKKGDIVHNVAIGDFGNEGRLLSDGKYLRDLQYTYDVVGHLPPWLDSLSLSPGYFHNILAASTPNPVIYANVSPFISQIRDSMRLVTENAQVTSSQGAYNVKRFGYHSVVRIKPGTIIGQTPQGPEVVQEEWVGEITLETEGTNEAAQALYDRAKVKAPTPWRIIRERSRPGRLVMRPVQPHEKVN